MIEAFHQQNDTIHSHSARQVLLGWITQLKNVCLLYKVLCTSSLVFLHIEEMSYGENSGIQVGLFSGPLRLSGPETTPLFAGTTSSPDQFSTGSLIYSPATLAHQPVPLRGSGSDPCPDLKHLPCRLPKRPAPYPLESPSVHARFG